LNRIEYILVEKSFIVRKGIKALLEDFGSFRQVADLPTAQNLSRLVNEHNPSLVFINTLELPVNFFNEFIHSIPAAKRPVLIAINNADTLDETASFAKFQVNLVAEQEETEAVFKQIAELFQDTTDDDKTELTTREQDILRTVALGLTNKEIAEKLFISQHTVITHRKNITRKLGIKSVSGLTVYAILNNLLSADEVE